MATTKPRTEVAAELAEAAQAYYDSLPLEHFMESQRHAEQREITLCGFRFVRQKRPEVQCFNELLIQKRMRNGKLCQVVPDNMVVIWDEPFTGDLRYDVDLQPVAPFLVIEYVSKSNMEKDYVKSFRKFERVLKVPYFLRHYMLAEELSLYKHKGKKYKSVLPNEHGRLAIPELEMEVGLVDNWLRYWFRGKLVPITAEMMRKMAKVEKQLREERKHAESLQHYLDQEKQRAAHEKLRADNAESALQAALAELARRNGKNANGKK